MNNNNNKNKKDAKTAYRPYGCAIGKKLPPLHSPVGSTFSAFAFTVSLTFFQPMNFVDFLAILPYVLAALIESMEDLQILGKAGKIMRLVRVMRILRIFKLVRHFAGLQSLIYTLKQVIDID